MYKHIDHHLEQFGAWAPLQKQRPELALRPVGLST
jgi:hypothetical protein